MEQTTKSAAGGPEAAPFRIVTSASSNPHKVRKLLMAMPRYTGNVVS
jgi:hypothetical protein